MSRLQYAGLMWAVLFSGSMAADEPEARVFLMLAALVASSFASWEIFDAIHRWRSKRGRATPAE